MKLSSKQYFIFALLATSLTASLLTHNSDSLMTPTAYTVLKKQNTSLNSITFKDLPQGEYLQKIEQENRERQILESLNLKKQLNYDFLTAYDEKCFSNILKKKTCSFTDGKTQSLITVDGINYFKTKEDSISKNQSQTYLITVYKKFDDKTWTSHKVKGSVVNEKGESIELYTPEIAYNNQILLFKFLTKAFTDENTYINAKSLKEQLKGKTYE